MNYIEGCVLAVPTKNKEDYIEHAKFSAEIFKDHGALKLVDCWGDDVPDGKLTSFPMAVKCKDDETVCFSWVTWPSKEVRDRGMQKLMQDPRMDPEVTPIPFDGARMIFGGFQVIVES